MLDISSLRPSDTPEYMTPAWLGCIHYALGNEHIVTAFRCETGNNWEPSSTPFERMIDEACGADNAFLKEFILWVNDNLWGPIDGKELED